MNTITKNTINKSSGKSYRKYKLSGRKILYRSTGKAFFKGKRGSAYKLYNQLKLDEVRVYI